MIETCRLSQKGKGMSLKFRGDYAKLKKCVARSGLDGSWKKLPNGTRQYFTDDGGVLNWHPTKGSVWFQGEDDAAEELERKFKAAAKERVGSGSLKSQKFVEEDIDTIKKLLATAIFKVEELRRRRPTA
jgi:hypothetical protein